MIERASGVLLHITSLPSPYGIGSLGEQAFRFVDFLYRAGQRYWQILPVGPTGYGNSPYQSYSAFAGNPNLIDLDRMAECGWLEPEEITALEWGEDPQYVDFDTVEKNRAVLFEKAWLRAGRQPVEGLDEFCEENGDWLRDYALFMALKEKMKNLPWTQWPEEIRNAKGNGSENNALTQYGKELEERVRYYQFIQFVFYRQWKELHRYAEQQGIRIIGDIPIYVPMDSADVWANPEQFQMDQDLIPKAVAGVPPDYFSEDGQLWGNPLYDWEAMAKDGYSWWISRMKHASELFDVIRIDHFRGLSSYWSVPYGSETAKEGTWMKGPGLPFIETIKKEGIRADIIAEDLGDLSEDVHELLRESGYPGMKILEFSFDDAADNDYRPHNYDRNCICYAGTHDNAVLCQWLDEMEPEDLELAKRYMGLNRKEGYAEGVIRTGMESVADLFVLQMQDWLRLGKESRMNVPGTIGGNNWKWRMDKDALSDKLASEILEYTIRYERTVRT